MADFPLLSLRFADALAVSRLGFDVLRGGAGSVRLFVSADWAVELRLVGLEGLPVRGG